MTRKVTDVMTSEVIVARPSTAYKELVRLLTEHRIGAVPVVDGDRHVLGVVSAADLLLKQERPADVFQRSLLASKRHRLERLKAAGGTAVEVMTAPASTIRSDASAAEAARLLRRNLIKQLPVIDSAGRLVGIVSRSDILKIFLRPDEEIRREILDQLFRGRSAPGPERLQVGVRDGVVLLEGACERRSHIPVLVRAVAGVEGVGRVENRLGFDLDDLSSLPFTRSRSLL